jgi:hypothetical protein
MSERAVCHVLWGEEMEQHKIFQTISTFRYKILSSCSFLSPNLFSITYSTHIIMIFTLSITLTSLFLEIPKLNLLTMSLISPSSISYGIIGMPYL